MGYIEHNGVVYELDENGFTGRILSSCGSGWCWPDKPGRQQQAD